MAQLIPNTFSSFIMSEYEEQAAQILSPLQKMAIQNKLATIAQDKLNLTFDTTNPASFAQSEAYLRGQLDSLNWLLDTSQSVEDEAERKLQHNSSSEE